MEPEPPWARFPDYEHLCLGWRMGAGESYLSEWWAYVATVPLADRQAYLERHPAAPYSWYEAVWGVLGHDEAPEADGLQQLIDRELVASDIAYRTWKGDADWPWDLATNLVDAARYDTRRFSFVSRARAADSRRATVTIPYRWRRVTPAIRQGAPGPVDPREGLKTLAVFLCVGRVPGPWMLGMRVEDFEDSFDNDMNYVDAFRLWMMSVFDDQPHYAREVERLQPSEPWRRWMDAEMYLPSDG